MTESLLPTLRHLLRHTAQPVSVITANLSFPASSIHKHDHGATLSSFSSISFNPPLVAFSLRLPSRLANAFTSHGDQDKINSSETAYFHVHLLERQQEDLARLFARQQQAHQAQAEGDQVDGFPIQAFEALRDGALGILECQLAHTVHLDELDSKKSDIQIKGAPQQQSEVKSCLFIARVLDVKLGAQVKGKPLVWHDQQYRAV